MTNPTAQTSVRLCDYQQHSWVTLSAPTDHTQREVCTACGLQAQWQS